MRLLGLLARRVALAVPVLLGVVVLNFALLQAAPGDLADVLAGEQGFATPEMMAELRARFGLDQPLPSQLLSYLGRVLSGDLGVSHRLGMPVTEAILQRLPATLLLVLPAIALAAFVGAAAGLVAARRPGGVLDGTITAAVLLAYALPLFWVGLMLIVLFAVRLGWLPVGGFGTPGVELSGIPLLLDRARHMALPVVTLALFYAALYARLMRASMLATLGEDYVRTARAKGLSSWQVEVVHAGRNALLPLITAVGLQAGSVLGGAVLVETVFSWPGLGRLAFEAVLRRDLNLLLGILLASALVVVLVNIAVDLLYGLADPRVEAG